MHQSFLDHAGRRYLKVALALCAASIALYAWHDPRSPPNGGTWLGYTLGGIGARASASNARTFSFVTPAR